MSNRDYLINIIDDSYLEIGKSGKLFNKNDVVEELLSFKQDRDITIYNYEFIELNGNVYMVHYMTKTNNKIIYR